MADCWGRSVDRSRRPGLHDLLPDAVRSRPSRPTTTRFALATAGLVSVTRGGPSRNRVELVCRGSRCTPCRCIAPPATRHHAGRRRCRGARHTTGARRIVGSPWTTLRSGQVRLSFRQPSDPAQIRWDGSPYQSSQDSTASLRPIRLATGGDPSVAAAVDGRSEAHFLPLESPGDCDAKKTSRRVGIEGAVCCGAVRSGVVGPSSGWSRACSLDTVAPPRYDPGQPVVVLRVPVGAIESAGVAATRATAQSCAARRDQRSLLAR